MFPGKIIHKESYKVNPLFADLQGFIKDLPYNYSRMGKTIYKGRNELKEIVILWRNATAGSWTRISFQENLQVVQ